MVAVDGSESSYQALDGAIKLLQPEDHLFVVTVRERIAELESETNHIILTNKLWQAASDIIHLCQEKLEKAHVNHTSIMPEAHDAYVFLQ